MNKAIKTFVDKTIEIANIEMPEIVEKTMEAVTEAMTGLVKSSKSDVATSLGNIAQRIVAGQKLSAFLVEWENLRKKGKVKDGYSKSLQSKYTLLELLNFLESDIPDEERFQVLKNILLVAASEDKSTREDVKPQQFMQIIKKLPSGAVLVLTSAYKLSKKPPIYDGQNGGTDGSAWRKTIAEESGLEYPELVANYEQVLIDNRLMNPPRYNDGSEVKLGQYFRLTSLGYEICSFANHYEELIK